MPTDTAHQTWDATWQTPTSGVPRRLGFAGETLALEAHPFPSRTPRARPEPIRILAVRPEGPPRPLWAFDRYADESGGPEVARPVAFAPALHWAESSDGLLLLSRTDEYRLRSLDPSSESVTTLFEMELPPGAPVTEEMRQLVRAQTLRRYTENRARSPLSRVDEAVMRESIQRMRFAERLPVTAEVATGMTSWVLL